jgi:hypothetical protein
MLTAAGILDKARARTAVTRAGGQMAPSKYLPDVPRQVHADGGKVAFMQGNHPDVPPVMYHGTGAAKDFSSFSLPGNKTNRKTGGNAIYLSTSPETAGTFANYGESPRIIPAHVSAKNPFDFRNPDHIDALQGALTKNFKNWFSGAMYSPQTAINWMRGGDFGLLENDNVRSWMKRRGHDSYFVTEGEGKPLNLAVFKPEQVKSAISNQGTFDPNDPDITKAEGGAATAPMFQGIHPDLQGEGGSPLDLYHGSGQDKEFEAFDNSKLGERDAGFYGRGHYLTPIKGNAEGYADPDEMGRGTVIGPLHAALKNPYVWDVSNDMKAHSTLRDLQSMGIMREKDELNPWDNLQRHHIQPFMAEMQKRGHDGVIVKTQDHEGDQPSRVSEVVAFNPNTIKHKDAEVFDPNDPRIRRNDGGMVGKAGGGEMNSVLGNNQNGDFNVGTQAEAGVAPINPAPRAQAGELRDAGGIRGGAGILPAPHEAPLEGLLTPVKIPMTGQVIHAGPDPRVRQVARDYMASTGLPYNPPKKYARVDPSRSERISDAYEAMKDDASDPLTKASYDAMIKETMAQYRAAKAAGFKAEFWNPQTEEDPYHASPRLATEDIRNNHHMFVYPTEDGYGSDGPITEEKIKNNPMLQPSGETWNGVPVTVNDIFRAVHDYFGHAKEGVGFRDDGEENAWRAHASMFSPLARMAMTTETRGQNSWLNYGPFGEKNRKARTKDSTFAPQKVGVLPHWVHHEGAEDFMGPEEVNAMAAIRKVHGKASGGTVDAALALTRRFSKDGTGATMALKSKGK